MSLIAQMVSSSDSVETESSLENSELPLFAAANQLSKAKAKNRKIISVMLLLAVLLAVYWIVSVNKLFFVDIIMPQHASPSSILSSYTDSSLVVQQQTDQSIMNELNEPVTQAIAQPVTKQEPLAVVEEPVVLPQEEARAQIQEPRIETIKTDKVVATVSEQSAKRLTIEKNNVAVEPNIKSSLGSKADMAQTLSIKKSSATSLEVQDKRLVSEAEQMIYERRHGAAISLLNKELDKTLLPNSAELLVGLLIAENRMTAAESRIAEFRKFFAQSLTIEKHALQIEMLKHNYDFVLQRVSKLAVPIKVDTGFYEFKAAALQAKGDYAEAASSYQTLIQFDAKKSKWWIGLAINFDAMASFAEAKQAYRQALMNNDLNGELSLYANQRLAQL